jgi:lysophospholipase L1-like esterase
MRSPVILTMFAICQFVAASGCGKALPEQNITNNVSDSGRSFLALGDSYTIGESVSIAERFPAQTAVLLRAKGIAVKDPVYIARTGWTTTDLKNAIASSTLTPPYDIVTLLIGVNDQYQGMDTAGYRTRFTQLLQKAIELAGNKTDHVYVLSIPDYGVTPFGGGSARISKEIDDFNMINKEITLAYGVRYVDITPISKKAANDQSYTAGDGLHPSGKQYGEWGLLISN